MKYSCLFVISLCMAFFACKSSESEMEAFKNSSEFQELCQKYRSFSKHDLITEAMAQEKAYLESATLEQKKSYMAAKVDFHKKLKEINESAQTNGWSEGKKVELQNLELSKLDLPQFALDFERSFLENSTERLVYEAEALEIVEKNKHLFSSPSALEAILNQCVNQ